MSQTRSLHKAPRGGDLFVFGIPLRPKCRTADWDGAVRRFRSALLSCLAQTDPDFRVLVACNERPEGMPDDPRVEYL
ncbi:hypothetical protein, partial [uncultured Abyssibacter sp.]|uniref:hypothetical protein n=1 Tax=uncultured Abyssibacter sp. TaxID=2320202 RepID=UPI0032B1ADBF